MNPQSRDMQRLSGESNTLQSSSGIPQLRKNRPNDDQGRSMRRNSRIRTNSQNLLSPERARRIGGANPWNDVSAFRHGSFASPNHNHLNQTPSRSQASRPGLTKSQTTPALLSPGRHVVSRSLLRAIEPPLPQADTFTGLLSPARRRPITATSTDRAGKYEIRRNATQEARYLNGQPCTPSCETAVSTSHTGAEIHAPEPRCDETDHDPRYVYIEQHCSYWLGRYTAVSDSLRNKQLNANKKSWSAQTGASKPRHKSSAEFDRAEKQVHAETVDLLVSFCQTEAAFASLQQFFHDLKKQRPSPRVSIAQFPRPQHPTIYRPRRSYPINLAKPKAHRPGSTLSSEMFRKSTTTATSSSSEPERLLRKSFTTNNLAVSINDSGVASDSSERAHARAKYGHFSQHTIPEELSQSVLHNEETALSRRQALPKSVSERTFNMVRPNIINSPEEKSVSSPLLKVVRLESSSPSDIAKQRTCTDPPGRERQPALHVVDGSQSQESFDESFGETTWSGRRFRKSDSMKRLVDAGLSQIKRIGHRVSNASISKEDLH